MTLEEYKKKVEECLIQNHFYTIERARKLMMVYNQDFQMFLNKKFSPELAAQAMIVGY